MTSFEFKSNVLNWANKLGVERKIKRIQLRKMKRKYASCSSKGNLTFNKEILELKKEQINHIIIHELLHFRYPNHGKMFKLTLKRLIKSNTLHH